MPSHRFKRLNLFYLHCRATPNSKIKHKKSSLLELGGNTGTYNAIQLQYKTADSKDQNITAVFANAAASCTVDLTGWTAGSSSEAEYVEVLAYDADGNVVATVSGKTSANKSCGAFATITVAPDDSTKTISKIVIRCKVDTKSYFVTAATIKYSVA